MRKCKRLVETAILAVAAAFAAPGGAQPASTGPGQAYPNRPVRFVVPFPPGGGNDIVGRIVAQRLVEPLGVPVVVDNRGGAGGTIGTDIVAKAPPDGHTMLVNNISLAVNATLYPKLPYNTLHNLAPVTLIGRQPNLLVAHPSVSISTVRDLLAAARAKPGQITFATGGVGTAGHLATELLMLSAKIEMVHVPYKGLGPALVDLMGGRVQVAVSTLASAMPQLKGGKLKAIAVTTAKRTAFFPDLPTLAEAGVPGYEFSTWYGLLVTGGTPKTVIDRLNAAARGVLGSPAVREQFAGQGLEATPGSVEEFTAYLKSEVAKWGKVIRAAGIRPD